MSDHWYIPQPPVKIDKGEHYFIVRCPATNRIIQADHDPSRGKKPYMGGAAGQTTVPCSDCQTHHTVDNHTIRSELG